MNYPGIRIEGAILSPDILDRIEELPGQRPTDFGFDAAVRVKDEIVRAWADAQDYWRIFNRKLDSLNADAPATTETRNQWIVPLLGLLGFQPMYQARGEEINGKSYPISHRIVNRANMACHIIGCREPAGLGRAVKGLVIALVMSVFAFSVTKILLGVVDQLSEGVVSYTMGTDIAGLGKRLALGSIEGVTNPGLVLIFSLVILAAVAVVWGAMVIRKMLVIIAAVLTPLAFSGATADITAGWVRRWIEFMAAMIASKLLLVIIFMIGVSVMEGAGMTSQPGPGQQLTQIATGALILLLAGFAPWAAIKMFHFTGDALHSAHATATAAPSGARTVLSAPQKVNVMHSQASHAAAKFSGSSPSAPASAQPPRDSADLLNANPAPNGGSAGPASTAGADKGLSAATAANPVGSAAGSSAAGAGSSAAAVGSLGAAAAIAAPVVVAAGASAATKKVVTATTSGVGQAAPAPTKSPIQQ